MRIMADQGEVSDVVFEFGVLFLGDFALISCKFSADQIWDRNGLLSKY